MMFRILILFFVALPIIGNGQSTISNKWDTIYYSQNNQYYVLNLVGNTQVIYFDSLKYDNNRPITILIKNNTDDSVTIFYKSLMSSWVNFKERSGTFLKPGEYYSLSPIFNAQRLVHSSMLNAHFAFSYTVRNQSTETIIRLKGHVLLDSLPDFNSNEKSDFPLGQKPAFQAQSKRTSQIDTVTYYNQDQENYYFDLVGKNQKFIFDTVIYDNYRPITVFIKNNTPNKLNIYQRYHANTFWKHDAQQYIEPNEYLKVQLLVNQKFKAMAPFIGYLKIEYWDSLHPEHKNFELILKGSVGLASLPPFETGITYYSNSQIKSEKKPNSENDSLPIYIEYYENGGVKLEKFNRKGIRKRAYDQQGRIKNEWDDEDLRTEYYSNGKVKLKETKDPRTNSSPIVTHYFENGCLKKEEFANQTFIKEYDSLDCGKLTNINTKYLYGKIKTHHKEGEIIGQTILPNVGGRIEVKGEFSNGFLVNGVAAYYSQTGVLLFENKISNYTRDNILEESEEQGQQINLFDVNGKKTGLWITDEVTKQPITLTQDYYSVSYNDTKSFDFYQYEYINGDTAARVIFHEYGGVSNYLYINDKESRINSNQEFAKAYHTNGYIAFKSYQLKNGMLVGIEYSEEKENLIVSGRKGNCGKMIFKDNKLIEIHSVQKELPKLDNSSIETSYSNQLSLQDSCVEKGQFKHFELYNGFIYYYKSGTLIRTEKVVNGNIQGNPRVNFTEPKFHSAALENDLNFNGWTEAGEVDDLKFIILYVKPEELDGLKWQELKNFKNLEVLYYHSRVYRLEDFANYDSLKLAIQQNKGKQIQSQKYPWENPSTFIWDHVPSVIIMDSTKTATSFSVQIVDLPDVEATFPGGNENLHLWVKNNLVYPANVNVEGRVFVSFIVLKDGSITDVKIEKGLHPELDKEAKRLVRAMPKWKPAISNGLDVASRVRLPIMFKP